MQIVTLTIHETVPQSFINFETLVRFGDKELAVN